MSVDCIDYGVNLMSDLRIKSCELLVDLINDTKSLNIIVYAILNHGKKVTKKSEDLVKRSVDSLGRGEVKVKAKVVVLNDSVEVNNDEIPNEIAVNSEPTYNCRKDNVSVIKNEVKDILAVVHTYVTDNTKDNFVIFNDEVSDIIAVNIEELDNLLGVIDEPVVSKLSCLVAVVSDCCYNSVNELLVYNGSHLNNAVVNVVYEGLDEGSELLSCYLSCLDSGLNNNLKLCIRYDTYLVAKSTNGGEVLVKVSKENLESLKGLSSDGLVVNENLDLCNGNLGERKLVKKKSLGLDEAVNYIISVDSIVCYAECLGSYVKSYVELCNNALLSEIGMCICINGLVVLSNVLSELLSISHNLVNINAGSVIDFFLDCFVIVSMTNASGTDCSSAYTEHNSNDHYQRKNLETNLF